MADGFYAVSISVLLVIITRWSVSLGPYSGKGKPPMYGDYEAQRHWMEITYNLPVKEWYVNSSSNDLLYWGLDYPPLTAYHSWIAGAVANKLNPDWVALNRSRGYESPQHKLYMRYTVLVADVLVYFPAVLLFVFLHFHRRSSVEKALVASVILLYPGLILMDHGHFQYNSVSLGLTLWGILLLASQHDLLGSVAFSLALNYKQMELYHALPFFSYLLGTALRTKTWISTILKVIKLGVVVIATFALCWLPFLSSVPLTLQVLQRLFPFGRGIFEDKVANLWCSITILIKIKRLLSQAQVIRLSTWTTLGAVLPSSLNVLKNPSVDRFIFALVNSSLAFFLFSYQVHEKSILLAALPVCLLLDSKPLECTWFLIISTFSMWPLIQKDGQALSYVACMFLFLAVACHVLHILKAKPRKGLFLLSLLGAAGLHVGAWLIHPPPRYPDLWPVLISLYSFGHFLLFFLYFNYLQFSLPYIIPGRAKQKDH